MTHDAPLVQPMPLAKPMPTARCEDVTDQLHARAIARLKKQRDFAAHVLSYTMVNGILLIIWAVTSTGFFWPAFPMMGWGIGLVMNAWDVWHGDEFTGVQVSCDLARQQRRQLR